MTKINKGIVALILIALVAVSMIAIIFIGYAGIGPMSFLKPKTDTGVTQPTVYKYTRPVRFTVSDKYAGGGLPASITVYKYTTLESFDTGTCDANGVWTSNKAMTSGEKYYVYLSQSNATIYYEITIPSYTTPNTESYHYVSLDFYDMGTFTLTPYDPTGNPISDGTDWNTSGVNYPTFTIQIRNSEADSTPLLGVGGINSFFDPIRKLYREVIMVVKISGTHYEQVIVKNLNLLYSSATARYYGFSINPEKLTNDLKPDGTYNKDSSGEDMDGIWTFNMQLDCSALPSGVNQAFHVEFFLYSFDNLDNFKKYGTFLSDAYGLSTSVDFYVDT